MKLCERPDRLCGAPAGEAVLGKAAYVLLNQRKSEMTRMNIIHKLCIGFLSIYLFVTAIGCKSSKDNLLYLKSVTASPYGLCDSGGVIRNEWPNRKAIPCQNPVVPLSHSDILELTLHELEWRNMSSPGHMKRDFLLRVTIFTF